jgi:hypothetical protein
MNEAWFLYLCQASCSRISFHVGCHDSCSSCEAASSQVDNRFSVSLMQLPLIAAILMPKCTPRRVGLIVAECAHVAPPEALLQCCYAISSPSSISAAVGLQPQPSPFPFPVCMCGVEMHICRLSLQHTYSSIPVCARARAHTSARNTATTQFAFT